MTQEINDFSRRILDKILASAQQHDVAIIGILDDQTAEPQRQARLLRAFLERRRYGVQVLTLHWPSPQTHFVVSNIGKQDDFRLTLARLGRHFGARWVLIIPEGAKASTPCGPMKDVMAGSSPSKTAGSSNTFAASTKAAVRQTSPAWP